MTRINVMKPWLGRDESVAVAAVIESGWVAQGRKVAEFEAAFAGRMQSSHGVATSSCTTALHLSLVVAGIGSGDDVVVPSFSFIATANAVTYVGARPVFADVDPETGNLTADTIKAALTQATRAVIAVDQCGVPVDLESVRSLCDPLGILVIEDAACGVGSSYHERPVGAGAEIAAWSFHPRKLLTTGEGGMITTNNGEWADRVRTLREHAMSVSAAERHRSVRAPVESYPEVGYNCRLTDLQAAIGIVQLGKLDEMVRRRRTLAARYQRALADVPGLRCVTDPDGGETNYQSFWVEVGTDHPVDRDGLLERLAQADIAARHGVMAAHRQPAYAGGHHGEVVLPSTDRLTDCTLILPLFHQMSDDEQSRVVDVLRAG